MKDYKGKDATQPVYRIDSGVTALLGELRAIEQQAAVESGQWRQVSEIKKEQPPGKEFLPQWLLDSWKAQADELQARQAKGHLAVAQRVD